MQRKKKNEKHYNFWSLLDSRRLSGTNSLRAACLGDTVHCLLGHVLVWLMGDLGCMLQKGAAATSTACLAHACTACIS